jgi:hypothetical protein
MWRHNSISNERRMERERDNEKYVVDDGRSGCEGDSHSVLYLWN